MLNIEALVVKELETGYGNLNAQAKVCQDIILKAIAESPFNQNITIKGGVVMRSKTKNVRRATQDIDMDFLRYSLSDKAIDEFISTINCIDGIQISRFGKIEELKQQEYKGKRIYVQIKDLNDFSIECKIDVGVHSKLDVSQEEYCFDIAFDDEGASLLVNSNEQMFAEKLKSLLRFGIFSTRFKDVFDMYYLKNYVDPEKLNSCLDAFVFSDKNMRENDITDIRDRVRKIFSDKRYLSRLASSDKNWIGDDIGITTKAIVDFLSKI
jgi:predicted nucleotidyltransferase component of viral defense system